MGNFCRQRQFLPLRSAWYRRDAPANLEIEG